MSKNIFSENKGIIDDAYLNATDVEEARTSVREDVRETFVPGGVLITADCPYCGLQWKGILKWAEIAGFFLGQQVPNTAASKRGITMIFGCRKCSRTSPMTSSWDDVDRYVIRGVKMGALPRTIHGAREQVLAERAAQQAAAAGRR